MTYKVLVTGGAGFIGSFIADELVKEKHDVTVFDNLTEQVHDGKKPPYLNAYAKFVKGDVCDYEAIKKAVLDADIVFHQAAAVGIGQSMYEIKRFAQNNIIGTANLLHIVANEKHSLKKILLAASFSSYGEGAYKCENCGVVFPPLRTKVKIPQWELLCKCGKQLKPIPTPETKPLAPTSVYAVTKTSQEQMLLSVCRAYGVPSVAMRYFNTYGPRQSLSNPYTGVAAIFISRIKNNNRPLVYEDGMQTRDFISVHDIVKANMLAMDSKAADYEIFNVGTGSVMSIKGIAEVLAKLYKKDIKPEITNKFRKGDVRHCYADISRIKSKLDFSPKVSFEEGMKELAAWADKSISEDFAEKADKELHDKGLID